MLLPHITRVLADHFLRYDALRFQEFARANRAGTWIIVSDYVSREKDNMSDAFCYTIYPGVGTYADLAAEINEALPADLKKCKMVSLQGTAFLKDPRRFSYCFTLNKDRKAFNKKTDLRLMSRDFAKLVLAEKDGIFNNDRSLRAFRHALDQGRFNHDLLLDIFIAAAIAGAIAFIITRYASPQEILWISDRGEIIESFGGIAGPSFCGNWMGLCGWGVVNPAGVTVSAPLSRQEDFRWADALVRMPDHLAGTLATMDARARKFRKGAIKHAVVFNEVFCSPNDKPAKPDYHSNVRMIMLSVKPGQCNARRFTAAPTILGDGAMSMELRELMNMPEGLVPGTKQTAERYSATKVAHLLRRLHALTEVGETLVTVNELKAIIAAARWRD